MREDAAIKYVGMLRKRNLEGGDRFGIMGHNAFPMRVEHHEPIDRKATIAYLHKPH